MNIKEMMMQYLREEGFCPKEAVYGIDFKCEGRSYAYIYDSEDEQFFRLMMPYIFNVTDENRDAVMYALNSTNTDVKVVKAYTLVPDSVWLAFEVLLDRTPVLEDLVPRAIATLCGARRRFFEYIEKG